MGEPIRVQRKRSKGWKMPENTVYVGRPTKWGNPFIVGKSGGAYTKKVQDQRHAWQLYDSVARDRPHLVEAARRELRGKNLACFCPLPTQLLKNIAPCAVRGATPALALTAAALRARATGAA